jgi:hypothetical protein
VQAHGSPAMRYYATAQEKQSERRMVIRRLSFYAYGSKMRIYRNIRDPGSGTEKNRSPIPNINVLF